MAAKRHHYLPRFYLRGFADHRQRVRRYSRDEAKPVVMSVENAAVESGFYTYVDPAGEKQPHVEELLAAIEHQAARALRRLVDEQVFPPTRQDREAIAIFLALQIMRTPEQRRWLAALADYTEKLMLRRDQRRGGPRAPGGSRSSTLRREREGRHGHGGEPR